MTIRNRVCLALLCCVVAAGTLGAQAQQAPEKTPAPPAASPNANGNGTEERPALQRRNRYQLRLSDVLELSFPFTPEFNQTLTIQPDGFVTLRGAGSIRLEGQTVPEAVESVKTAYARILHDPVLTVELRDFEKPYFIVGGEVGRPGKFDLRGETSVVEAVAIAGGMLGSAKHSQVLLFRRVPDGWQKVRKLNVKKMLKDGDLQEVAYLQPGDFIFVPKSTFSKIAPFIPSSSLGMYMNPVRP